MQVRCQRPESRFIEEISMVGSSPSERLIECPIVRHYGIRERLHDAGRRGSKRTLSIPDLYCMSFPMKNSLFTLVSLLGVLSLGSCSPSQLSNPQQPGSPTDTPSSDCVAPLERVAFFEKTLTNLQKAHEEEIALLQSRIEGINAKLVKSVAKDRELKRMAAKKLDTGGAHQLALRMESHLDRALKPDLNCEDEEDWKSDWKSGRYTYLEVRSCSGKIGEWSAEALTLVSRIHSVELQFGAWAEPLPLDSLPFTIQLSSSGGISYDASIMGNIYSGMLTTFRVRNLEDSDDSDDHFFSANWYLDQPARGVATLMALHEAHCPKPQDGLTQ